MEMEHTWKEKVLFRPIVIAQSIFKPEIKLAFEAIFIFKSLNNDVRKQEVKNIPTFLPRKRLCHMR